MKRMMTVGLILLAIAATGKAQAQDEPYCREYQQNVTIGGKVKETYGTACMQPDGSWQKMDEPLAADETGGLQVAQFEPVEPLIYRQQVVYEEPVVYRPYYGGVGLSFGWSDRDRHRSHDRHGHRGHWRH